MSASENTNRATPSPTPSTQCGLSLGKLPQCVHLPTGVMKMSPPTAGDKWATPESGL